MFENPDYQVDEQSEEFRLLNPIVSKVGQKRKKKLRLLAQQAAASQQVLLNLDMSYISCTGQETSHSPCLQVCVSEWCLFDFLSIV